MRLVIALAAGILFGAGLTLSGMADPGRVRAFLDLGGAWDPTLAFVMAGAILPMAIAWRLQRRMPVSISGDGFSLPGTQLVDRPLAVGAILFGIGWGVAGLCPGPAVAGLALAPLPAAIFLLAMAAGMAGHGLWESRPSRSAGHGKDAA